MALSKDIDKPKPLENFTEMLFISVTKLFKVVLLRQLVSKIRKIINCLELYCYCVTGKSFPCPVIDSIEKYSFGIIADEGHAREKVLILRQKFLQPVVPV